MNSNISYALLCCVAVVFSLLTHSAHAGPSAKLVVVVAKDSPINNLSTSELKRAFLSDNVVIAGKKLVPFNFGLGTLERIGFDRCVLGMTDEVARRFWVDRKIRGQAEAPRALPSAAVVVKVATTFPGAIGYVRASDLRPEVRAVKIDGVAYNEPGYSITE